MHVYVCTYTCTYVYLSMQTYLHAHTQTHKQQDVARTPTYTYTHITHGTSITNESVMINLSQKIIFICSQYDTEILKVVFS